MAGRRVKDPFGNWVKATQTIVDFWGQGSGDFDFLAKNLHEGIDACIGDYKDAAAANAAAAIGQGPGSDQPATSGAPESSK